MLKTFSRTVDEKINVFKTVSVTLYVFIVNQLLYCVYFSNKPDDQSDKKLTTLV